MLIILIISLIVDYIQHITAHPGYDNIYKMATIIVRALRSERTRLSCNDRGHLGEEVFPRRRNLSIDFVPDLTPYISKVQNC